MKPKKLASINQRYFLLFSGLVFLLFWKSFFRDFFFDQTISFLVLGDFGVDEYDPEFMEELSNSLKIMNQMWKLTRYFRRSPKAVFITGDLAYPSGVQNDTDDRLIRVFDRFPFDFRIQQPFYAVPGNHDCEGDISAWLENRKRIFNWKSPEKGDLSYGENVFQLPWGAKLRVISLNTCPLVCTPNQNETARKRNFRCDLKMSKYSQEPRFFVEKQNQLNWMESLPEKHRNDWLIVLGHHPIFSFRGNGPTRELLGLLNWMRKLKVDIYFSGHDHALQYVQGGDSRDPKFFISGAGGYTIHSRLSSLADKSVNDENSAQLIHAQDSPGFMKLLVSSEYMTIEFFDLNGTETYKTRIWRK